MLSAEVDQLAVEGGELRARLQSMRVPQIPKHGEPVQFRNSMDELQLMHLLGTCFGPTWVLEESASKKHKMRYFVSSTDPGIRLNVEALTKFSDMLQGYLPLLPHLDGPSDFLTDRETEPFLQHLGQPPRGEPRGDLATSQA